MDSHKGDYGKVAATVFLFLIATSIYFAAGFYCGMIKVESAGLAKMDVGLINHNSRLSYLEDRAIAIDKVLNEIVLKAIVPGQKLTVDLPSGRKITFGSSSPIPQSDDKGTSK